MPLSWFGETVPCLHTEQLRRIGMESCFRPHVECKSNIYSPLTVLLVSTNFWEKICDALAAKCSAEFTSWLQTMLFFFLMFSLETAVAKNDTTRAMRLDPNSKVMVGQLNNEMKLTAKLCEATGGLQSQVIILCSFSMSVLFCTVIHMNYGHF